ncbi:MAG: hypothetical protein JW929_08080 [Anaerolineales bacterium]|nr:hypothetical protein [Anaerolineales bacterium]
MAGILDPLTFPTVNLPAVWCPKKEKLSGKRLALSIEEQAKGSLLQCADPVEAALRLIYGETEIERTFTPPEGYDEAVQGAWDDSQVTFAFRRRVWRETEERETDCLRMVYRMDGAGRFQTEITPERFTIAREG